jgi:hypothetical protein
MALVYVGFIFSRDIYLTIILFALLGACNVGRAMVAYILLMEMTPDKYKTLIGSLT